ncbi:hypothetical protein [Azotobacter beijerinckii]|uniref:Uncharacterized protein n=1 Tax=Azotobacter beijerinckii TaxID=170623 RepID=A0A1I4CEX6_9GAMM|nr:hypothetical protein [Azotobacter beijerinckii]SFK78857.1 hypothetical protein SAMN04244574_01860 [Azotobacter beijerinckii]
MTLVVVGHEFEKKVTFSWGKDTGDTPKKAGMKPVGLFAVADSSITAPNSNGKQTILGGFRKIYPVEIKVWEPFFNGVYFRGYLEVHYEAECFVAIAGSTLTAQHVLNLISEHLRKIRISYERAKELLTPGKYVLIRHCQRNELEVNQGIDEWAEDMFTPNDYIDLVTASDIAKIVEYSINEALTSARKYKIDEQSLKAMYSEFAVGIYCPKEKNHQLFVFRMKNRINAEGLLEVYAAKERIEEGRVAVLGMKSEFEVMAQDAMQTAIEEEISPSRKFFDFINKAIDKVRDNGSFAIDRPSVCKVFQEGQLKTVFHQK